MYNIYNIYNTKRWAIPNRLDERKESSLYVHGNVNVNDSREEPGVRPLDGFFESEPFKKHTVYGNLNLSSIS